MHNVYNIFRQGQKRTYMTTALDRKIREVPYLSRYVILEKLKKKPRYMSECVGTPRRAYDYNTFDKIRYKPTFNPYVHLNKDKKYRLDNWKSRYANVNNICFISYRMFLFYYFFFFFFI
ncbi:hypothetical protein PFMALIP_01817 [Plasmodium falciparum MaliPS096_E11]|uniref:Uncharacterized protein n=1 Tax=Plasmodium falciparum MaliPS096_E11 TaxID=1036727 RepID=A0A024WSE8_PLAFA|nr:hypothetical protein PFMALIP_01817 [Plasmodium falciparum MaliPS096_E11]